jgi:hypothetical protein
LVEFVTLDYVGLMTANNQLDSVTEMLVDSGETFLQKSRINILQEVSAP